MTVSWPSCCKRVGEGEAGIVLAGDDAVADPHAVDRLLRLECGRPPPARRRDRSPRAGASGPASTPRAWAAVITPVAAIGWPSARGAVVSSMTDRPRARRGRSGRSWPAGAAASAAPPPSRHRPPAAAGRSDSELAHRIDERMGQPDDEDRRQQDAEDDQPERRAMRRLLARDQIQQQADGGKLAGASAPAASDAAATTAAARRRSVSSIHGAAKAKLPSVHIG